MAGHAEVATLAGVSTEYHWYSTKGSTCRGRGGSEQRNFEHVTIRGEERENNTVSPTLGDIQAALSCRSAALGPRAAGRGPQAEAAAAAAAEAGSTAEGVRRQHKHRAVRVLDHL